MENTSKTSIISVVGNGHIEAEANILAISVTVYKVEETIKQAQEEVNRIVSNLLNIFKESKVNENNVHTASIEFEPNYTWENNKIKYTGQRVEQKLICVIENIKNNVSMVINILDKITIKNNSIKLRLDFGIKENSEMVVTCRELAYQDGYEKAKRYAELAGLKIIKAVKISERRGYDYDDGPFKECLLIGGGPPTQLPMGKVEKSMTLHIDFIAE